MASISANEIALNRLNFERETFDTLQIRTRLERSAIARIEESIEVRGVFNAKLNTLYTVLSDGTLK